MELGRVYDFGDRKGVRHFNGLEELPMPSQMEELCEKQRRKEICLYGKVMLPNQQRVSC
uniref:Uncharacterized protein n=1 Tax=Kalanchoe fedtschenkoi TaxID=63787 RepID=A0A7N0U4R6_KALFE